MLSIIIPTIQKNVFVLNKLVQELVEDNIIDEIIIIDNSLKGYVFNSPKVKVFIPPENLYVNPAWNYGIKKIKNEYFGILNDDILIPKNFCLQVYNFLQENEKIGLVGLDNSIVYNTSIENFAEYPQNVNLKFRICNYKKLRFWGSAIFGKKENYYPIPEDIKIWSGDNYLYKKNRDNKKKNFKICGGVVKHLCSLSSGDPKFLKIKENDIYLYSLIDKNYKNNLNSQKRFNFLEKIFSVRNASEKGYKILTLLGFKVKFHRLF